MMWARVVELLLAGWLALAAWVLGPAAWGAPTADLAIAALAAAASLACFHRPLERLHAVTFALGVALALLGLSAGADAAPLEQSRLGGGLLLAMFAVVPSRSSRPPRGWREYAEAWRRQAE
jgi:hypothetical protein